MGIISGGWTEDIVVVDVLDSSGLITTIWEESIKQLTHFKLCSKELTGTLTQAEENLRQQLISQAGQSSWAVDRIEMFVKQETVYWTKGMYMTGDELSICIDNQWVNILKCYS